MERKVSEGLYSEIAASIRACRQARGVTLEDLAHRAGIGTSFLGQIERRERKPSIATVAQIARCLGVPMSTLLEAKPHRKAASDGWDRKVDALLKGASDDQRLAAYMTVRFVLGLLRRQAAPR